MTIQERAKTVTDEVGTATTGAELRALIVQALRDQIEECAQVVDHKIETYEREGNLTLYWLFKHAADEIRAAMGEGK